MAEKAMVSKVSESDLITGLALRDIPELQAWPNQFRLRAAELALFLKIYDLPENADILEIGCGNGFSSAFLSKKAKRVIATDLFRQDNLSHSVGIEKAYYLLQNLNVNNCRLVSCAAQDLPFSDSSFDIVFNEYVLEHIPDKARMLKDIRRVLKAGGLCISIVPSYVERLFSIPAFYIYMGKRFIYHCLVSLNKKKNDSRKMKSVINNFSQKCSNFPLPQSHGYYFSWKEEFLAHLPNRWIRLFEECGFKVENSFSLMFVPWNLLEVLNINLATWLYEKSKRLTGFLSNLKASAYFGYNLCFILRKS